MKRIACISFWGCAIFLAVSCHNSAPSESVAVEHILKPLMESTEVTVGVESHIDSLEVIPIKDTSISLSTISKILLDKNGNLFVLDFSGSIFSFNQQGENYQEMPEHGRASNEYIRATDICISEKELMVLDEPLVRCFSLDNLKEVRLIDLPLDTPIDAIAPFGADGVYLFSAFSAQRPMVTGKKDYLLSSYDAGGNRIKKYIQTEDVTFSMFNISQACYNKYYLRPQNSTNIFYLLSQDEPLAAYKLDFGNENIPKRYYYDVVDEDMVRYTTSDYYKLPMELHETTKHLYFRVAGKDAIEHCFVYNLATKKAISWKDCQDDYELRIQGADKNWFYAITPYLDNDEQVEHGPFYNYVSNRIHGIDETSRFHFYIVKIKYK